jgi:hypothetical protein
LIAGLARDKESGEGLEHVEITAGTHKIESGAHGNYQLEGLTPGTYTLAGTYAGQTITVANIDVGAGQATFVDLPFTPGAPASFSEDYRSQGEGEVEYFTASVPRIEGTVSDSESHARVPGAVVTAVAAERANDAMQTVTDDAGRFKFEPTPTGTYAVSAYYSVGGHGQIEVRRSDITIGEGKGAFVPLQIETEK